SHRMLQAVAREAERDQRIVVRPDRSVVIGHRVVADFAPRDGADAPSRKELLAHQVGRDPPGTVGSDNAGEQKLTRVGSSHPAWLLGAVERQRIRAEFPAPERVLEALREKLRRGLELYRPIGHSETQGTTRRKPLTGKDISL